MSEQAQRPNGSNDLGAGSGMIDALAALGVTVLAILGLAGLYRGLLAAVAVIVLGVALVSLGAAVVARYANMTSGQIELGGGIAIEILGGVTAIILGLLALLQVASVDLVAIAIIVLGGALLLGGNILSRIDRIGQAGSVQGRQAAREAIVATAGVQALVGGVGVTLGILAVVGIQREILILVALLAFGVALLLSSAAVTGRLLNLMRAA